MQQYLACCSKRDGDMSMNLQVVYIIEAHKNNELASRLVREILP